MPISDLPIEKNRNSLGFILSVIIGIAVLMVMTATIIFLRSGAYATVKQIQIGSRVSNNFNEIGLDTTSPIKSTDINELSKSVVSRVRPLDDAADFNANDVSDFALGLNR